MCSNKLFYLAVPPSDYELIFRQLAASGLTIECSDDTGWTRVLVEKPFGDDQETARELDTLLGSLFREEQIYRIDHYLAKEMLQGILNFRFTNNLFEIRVEPPGHRGDRHHAARADRRREARSVLRPRRRAARRRAEPPAADARARHDGAARVA